MSALHAAAEAVRSRQVTRAAQLLDGLVLGMIADGELNDLEIQHLNTWLSQNEAVTQVWPGSVIATHVRQVMADGVITADERVSLLAALQQLTNSDFAETGSVAPEVAGLPYDESCAVVLQDAGVCHTGEFLYGTRSSCERLSEKGGAVVLSSVTRKVRYLVVGTHVSPNWISESYGRKIQAAIELQQKGHAIAVIPERRWMDALAAVQSTP